MKNTIGDIQQLMASYGIQITEEIIENAKKQVDNLTEKKIEKKMYCGLFKISLGAATSIGIDLDLKRFLEKNGTMVHPDELPILEKLAPNYRLIYKTENETFKVSKKFGMKVPYLQLEAMEKERKYVEYQMGEEYQLVKLFDPGQAEKMYKKAFEEYVDNLEAQLKKKKH